MAKPGSRGARAHDVLHERPKVGRDSRPRVFWRPSKRPHFQLRNHFEGGFLHAKYQSHVPDKSQGMRRLSYEGSEVGRNPHPRSL
jgi:hypothetical protein